MTSKGYYKLVKEKINRKVDLEDALKDIHRLMLHDINKDISKLISHEAYLYRKIILKQIIKSRKIIDMINEDNLLDFKIDRDYFKNKIKNRSPLLYSYIQYS
jgi:hypothetical protein